MVEGRYIYLVSSGFSITMNFKTELAITQSISMIPLNIIDIEAYTINSDVDLNEGQSESSDINIVEDMSYYLSYMTLNNIDMIKTFDESHGLTYDIKESEGGRDCSIYHITGRSQLPTHNGFN